MDRHLHIHIHRAPVRDTRAPTAAGVVCCSVDGRVLLIQRAENSVHGGTWGIPAGTIERGEPPRAAAFRECYEEVGYGPVMSAEPIWKSNDFHCFYARTQKFVPMLNQEHTAFMWAPFDNLPKNLHPYIREQVQAAIAKQKDTA